MRYGLKMVVDISDEAVAEGIAERHGGLPLGTMGISPTDVEMDYAFRTEVGRTEAHHAIEATGIRIKSSNWYSRMQEIPPPPRGELRDFGNRIEERGRAHTRPREEDVAGGFFEADHFF